MANSTVPQLSIIDTSSPENFSSVQQSASTSQGVHLISREIFDEGVSIGRGSFGICCRIVFPHSPEPNFVLKYAYPNNYSAQKQIKNEIEILSKINHLNIVSFIASVFDDTNPYWFGYIMEYCPDGCLHDFILKEKYPPEVSKNFSFWMDICRQLSNAIFYLHEDEKIIHGDINPKNVLLKTGDEGYIVKLGDFGTSFNFQENTQHMDATTETFHRISKFGTALYSAPEVHYGQGCNTSSDVFAFAMTAYFTMYKQEPLLDWNGDPDTLVGCVRESAEKLHGYGYIDDTGFHTREAPQRPKLGDGGFVDEIIEAAWSHVHMDRPAIAEIVGIFKKLDKLSTSD